MSVSAIRPVERLVVISKTTSRMRNRYQRVEQSLSSSFDVIDHVFFCRVTWMLFPTNAILSSRESISSSNGNLPCSIQCTSRHAPSQSEYESGNWIAFTGRCIIHNLWKHNLGLGLNRFAHNMNCLGWCVQHDENTHPTQAVSDACSPVEMLQCNSQTEKDSQQALHLRISLKGCWMSQAVSFTFKRLKFSAPQQWLLSHYSQVNGLNLNCLKWLFGSLHVWCGVDLALNRNCQDLKESGLLSHDRKSRISSEPRPLNFTHFGDLPHQENVETLV